MSVLVLAPGALTTLQDRGRVGSRALGVGVAGALDPYSSAIANLLVGNPVAAATLEITLSGPKLRLSQAARIALCGGDFDLRIDGTAVAGWRRVTVPAGATVAIGGCRRCARAWLAISGGFRAPRRMDSLSTDLRGGFGGIDGRALVAGDVLDIGDAGVAMNIRDADGMDVARWWIDRSPDLAFGQPARIHAIAGADACVPKDGLFAREWRVTADSNRQGLRLEPTTTRASTGEAPLRPADLRERISEPVAPGTIQLPPDGQPIVLLADAQTHGGYPRIAHAIQADWPRLAQLRPGDRLRFEACSREDAWQARRAQAQRLARIALAIAARAAQRPS
ncbi:biotin-dependent carboxyltransferase family protein [Cognatiluteimonas telluris]|uniref:5-oxoprolinase subunit C family protein n=1 Tax=Cognatiluteimonas telluris TaxID=1104775 RepID=UPI00140BFD72|nr:biotin-dependent carboxyltransferase family protein [Lysobacter telluris]